MYAVAAPDKERPVVVLTRDSAIRVLSRVLVAPVTSTIRNVPSQVMLGEEHGRKRRSAVNLDGVMTVSQSRLGMWIGRLGPGKMFDVCEALKVATGCESDMAREDIWML